MGTGTGTGGLVGQARKFTHSMQSTGGARGCAHMRVCSVQAAVHACCLCIRASYANTRALSSHLAEFRNTDLTVQELMFHPLASLSALASLCIASGMYTYERGKAGACACCWGACLLAQDTSTLLLPPLPAAAQAVLVRAT